MPPLPLVAFEVIIARTGTPASLPAPTPTPTLGADARPLLDRRELHRDRRAVQLLQVVVHRQQADAGDLAPRGVDLAGRLVGDRLARLGHRRFLVERDLGRRVGLLRRRLDRIGLVVVERDRLLGRRLRQLGLGLGRRRRRLRLASCASSSLAIGAETTGRLRAVGLSHRQPRHQAGRRCAQVMRTRSAMRRKRASSSRRRRPRQDARAERDLAAARFRFACRGSRESSRLLFMETRPASDIRAGPHGSNLWRTANETSV